ncbi:nucleotidyltransferase family protein [Methylobacter luteus]|uniref:nucleotidyltransferase family protein n=1 Tax=Methylobacter luteus TaxID=415 RepID=UPI00041FAF19|nr:nucleotidyltransferase family protein [Methylobacter luteus]
MSSLIANPMYNGASNEKRILIMLSMIRNPPSYEEFENVLKARLNWPWIIMQAMHHRTICILWHTLKSRNLLNLACRSGLGKNWITYCEQLTRGSHKKNRLWLECLNNTLEHLKKDDIDMVCIKGSGLIGDIYEPELRMLGDIDTLIRTKDRARISAPLKELGYQHGVIDPITNTIKPLSKEKLRFWNFHSKIMPKFTLLTGKEEVPFVRLAVGFDLFDPGAEYGIGSDILLDHALQHPRYENLKVLDSLDTFVCQCAHVFREATSELFAYISDSWHLWKFCDLRELLYAYDSEDFRSAAIERAALYSVLPVVYFALMHTYAVYGDPLLLDWIETLEALDTPLAKFSRVISDEFADALFDPHPIALKTQKPEWSSVIEDGEWW